jgi:hypothetical protein
MPEKDRTLPATTEEAQARKMASKLDQCVREVMNNRKFIPEGIDADDVDSKRSAALAICRTRLGMK